MAESRNRPQIGLLLLIAIACLAGCGSPQMIEPNPAVIVVTVPVTVEVTPSTDESTSAPSEVDAMEVPIETPESEQAASTPEPLPIMGSSVTEARPSISDFETCPEPCNGVNAMSKFAQKTTRIHARWRYENLPYGAKYVRLWRMNGAEWVRYECTWTGAESGIDEVTLTEPRGLHSGTWEVSISVNDEEILNYTIEIQGNWNYWDPAGTFTSCYGKR